MASMTRAELRAEVQRLGRVGKNVSTSILDDWIYEAVKKLQDETLWLSKKIVYYVREYFTLNTNEGFNLQVGSSAYDIALTTAVIDISGEDLASYLYSEISATGKFNSTSIAVSYSTSSRKFTITADTGIAAIVISHPDYSTSILYDASYKLFGITDDASSADTYTITGDVAPYCTSEYPLPSDFLSVKEVRYDDKNYPLQPEIFKDRDTGTGTPSNYYIDNGYLGITPQPTEGGKKIELDYYYLPSDFASDSAVHPFPEIFNYAIIYYAISLYKDYLHDDNEMMKYLAKYEGEKRKIMSRKRARLGGGINLFDRSRTRYDPRRYNLRRY